MPADRNAPQGREAVVNGIANFRDFGGYPVASGGRIRTGALFRSSRPGRISADDEKSLAALGVSTVVDLRKPEERRTYPNGEWGLGMTIISDLDGDENPWGEFLQGDKLDVPSIRKYMLDFYRRAPYSRRHIELLSRYFRALATSPRPILVHCTSGKDRTGIVVALTHLLLGVRLAHIVADYLRSNRMLAGSRHDEEMRRAISAGIAVPAPPEVHRAFMRCRLEYLRASFDSIRLHSGSTDKYFTDVLGVDWAIRNAIIERLVCR
jgi:protein-tyrosine phosphatase